MIYILFGLEQHQFLQTITFLKDLFKDTAGGGVLAQTTELYVKESLENFLYLEILIFDNKC